MMVRNKGVVSEAKEFFSGLQKGPKKVQASAAETSVTRLWPWPAWKWL